MTCGNTTALKSLKACNHLPSWSIGRLDKQKSSLLFI